MIAASQGAVLTVWAVSLAVGVVVILVVAFLLSRVRRTAAHIAEGAEAIWTVGQLVANNTIQIPLFLGTSGRVVAAIQERTVDIAEAARAIERHAEGCPGCPACILPTR